MVDRRVDVARELRDWIINYEAPHSIAANQRIDDRVMHQMRFTAILRSVLASVHHRVSVAGRYCILKIEFFL